MIDRWSQNEERVAHTFLTSSAELDDNSPLVMNRTRKNIVRPVRKFLRTVDDGGKTEDESDSGMIETPVKVADKVCHHAIYSSTTRYFYAPNNFYSTVIVILILSTSWYVIIVRTKQQM